MDKMFSEIIRKFNYCMTRIPEQRTDINIPAYILDKYRAEFNKKDNLNRDNAKQHLIKNLTLGKLVYTYKTKQFIKYWDLLMETDIIDGKRTVTNVWRDKGNKKYPVVKIMNVQKKKYDDIYNK